MIIVLSGFNFRKITELQRTIIFIGRFQCLADIEEHLGITIGESGNDFKIPVDEFDGKVVYGEKRKNIGIYFINTLYMNI